MHYRPLDRSTGCTIEAALSTRSRFALLWHLSRILYLLSIIPPSSLKKIGVRRQHRQVPASVWLGRVARNYLARKASMRIHVCNDAQICPMRICWLCTSKHIGVAEWKRRRNSDVAEINITLSADLHAELKQCSVPRADVAVMILSYRIARPRGKLRCEIADPVPVDRYGDLLYA
jgi:hypothetical protein